MGKLNLDKRLRILQDFSCSKKKQNYINECPDSTIHCLSELIFNFLYSGPTNLGRGRGMVEKYRPLRKTLVTLASDKTEVRRKRKILETSPAIHLLIGRKLYPQLLKDYESGRCKT